MSMTGEKSTAQLPNWLFCILLSTVPVVVTFLDFTFDHGLLTLPRFGEVFRERSMEPVKKFAPPAKRDDVGYDGQFYAQIALDPSLQNPALKSACDNLSYRAKRIALPSFAYFLGGGQPWAVLQIYSILNLGFWFLLMVLLVREFGIESWTSRMMLTAILWNAGCLISIGRALTDLPALCLSVAAVCACQNRRANNQDKIETDFPQSFLSSIFASLSVLTKETAIISLFSFCGRPIGSRAWQWIARIAVIVMPIMLWSAYVRYRVGPDASGLGNFAPPLFGFFYKLNVTWSETIAFFPRFPLLELIAPWTIVAQVIFLLSHASLRSKWWHFGIGFAILAIFIGPWVWSTQSAYSRCLLPLTVSFNILLAQTNDHRSNFMKWWLLGNVGYLDRAVPGLLLLLVVDWIWGQKLKCYHRTASTT